MNPVVVRFDDSWISVIANVDDSFVVNGELQQLADGVNQHDRRIAGGGSSVYQSKTLLTRESLRSNSSWQTRLSRLFEEGALTL